MKPYIIIIPLLLTWWVRMSHSKSIVSTRVSEIQCKSNYQCSKNRTLLKRIRVDISVLPETSTSLVDPYMIRRRASDQHEALLRLADSLRQRYRRTAAAAHSVWRRPSSLLAPLGRAVALLKGPAAYLGRRSRGSSWGEAKVESHACVLGICICVRLFNVVDALRLAISGLTMPRRSRLYSGSLTIWHWDCTKRKSYWILANRWF